MSALKSALAYALLPAARLASRAQGLRRAWAHARFAARIEGRLDPSVVIQGVPEIHGTGKIRVGRELFLYRDLYFETNGDAEIVLGDRVVMSRGVHVVAFAGITIERGAMIGEYASIRDANHRIDGAGPLRDSGHDAIPIRIGEDAWIGRGVTVLPGVTIGARAVIGANAVVTKSVPDGAIAVGIPARVIGSRDAKRDQAAGRVAPAAQEAPCPAHA